MSGVRENLNPVRRLLEEQVESDTLMGAAVQVSVGGEILEPVLVGDRRLDGSAPVEADTIFLIASITKPIVCSAVIRLVEEGKILLDDPVKDFVPEFDQNGKEDVRIRHLLTHTSGLPDQIPENYAFREEKKPLSAFVDRICELPLAFPSGTRISYQSSGIAMLSEICERVTGVAMADYLHEKLFGPIGLVDTRLRMIERSARESDVKIAGEGVTNAGVGTDFDWNSDYWRGFGAPWGGMLTTVEEMTRLLLLFRNGGELDGYRYLSKAAVSAMVADQSSSFPEMSRSERLRQRWGLGWRLGGRNAGVFGDLVSEDTFGHGGATGTLAWVDPVRDITCVIFTNDPEAARSLRGRISNLVASV